MSALSNEALSAQAAILREFSERLLTQRDRLRQGHRVSMTRRTYGLEEAASMARQLAKDLDAAAGGPLALVVEIDLDAPEDEQGMVHAADCRNLIGAATIGRASYLDEIPQLVTDFYGYDDEDQLRYHAACVKLPASKVVK